MRSAHQARQIVSAWRPLHSWMSIGCCGPDRRLWRNEPVAVASRPHFDAAGHPVSHRYAVA
jgi:hypothetical protein